MQKDGVENVVAIAKMARKDVSMQSEAMAKEAARKAQTYTDKDMDPVVRKQADLKAEIARLKGKGIDVGYLEGLASASPGGTSIGDVEMLLGNVEGAIREAGGKEIAAKAGELVQLAAQMVSGGETVGRGNLFTAAINTGIGAMGIQQEIGGRGDVIG